MHKPLLALLVCGTVWGGCPDFPAAYDVRTIEYGIEKIGTSLQVRLEFPRLSTHGSCKSRAVQYGTLWEVELHKTDPIRVTARDRNGVLVQEYALFGPVDLKVTATRAWLRFFGATASKRILDYSVVSAELWSDAPLVPFPSVDWDDGGTRRTFPATRALY